MDTSYAPPAYRDRRTGLIVFGIVEIIIGCFCLLMVLMMFVGITAARATGSPMELKMILPSLVMYPVVAVVFIWLGIGSMTRRRWARALSLILAWSWLVIGIAGCVTMLAIMPAIFSGELRANGPMPAEARAVMIVVMVVVLGFMFIVMPGALVLFYRSPHVKATCEAADPQPRWTDACPLPVLAVSLWMLLGGLMMPLMPIAYGGVIPLFGVLVSGAAGTVIFLVLTVLWLYAAWAIYRLKPVGWWLTVMMLGVLTISNAVTFWTIDIMEMYRAMGYSEAMLQQIQMINFTGRTFVAGTLIGAAAIFGYFLFIYRYFRRGNGVSRP